VAAAIWRKHRASELDLDDSLTLIRAFTVDYAGTPRRPPRFIALAVTSEILERAAELAGTHGLRAYDAVQLASALTAREADERCAAVAAFDRGLLKAAVAEGFTNAAAQASRRTSRPSPPERPRSDPSGPRSKRG
jgi:predicted nucleic acid-binding protein